MVEHLINHNFVSFYFEYFCSFLGYKTENKMIWELYFVLSYNFFWIELYANISTNFFLFNQNRRQSKVTFYSRKK